MSGKGRKRQGIASPCINICMVHPEWRLCTGCFRTIDEIAGWTKMTDEERAAVMAELPARAATRRPRRGGRSGRLSRHAGKEG